MRLWLSYIIWGDNLHPQWGLTADVSRRKTEPVNLNIGHLTSSLMNSKFKKLRAGKENERSPRDLCITYKHPDTGTKTVPRKIKERKG